MQISTVSYSRLLNIGNYENERLDVSAIVLDGQSPETLLEELKAWTHHQLGLSYTEIKKDIEQLQIQRLDLQNDIASIERRIEQLKQQWQQAKTMLTLHGINVPDFPLVDAPEPEMSDPF